MDRIVEVTWEDSAMTHRWHHEAEQPTPSIARSVGFVTRDDEEGICLAESLDVSVSPAHNIARFGCETMIPRSAIRGVVVLKVLGAPTVPVDSAGLDKQLDGLVEAANLLLHRLGSPWENESADGTGGNCRFCNLPRTKAHYECPWKLLYGRAHEASAVLAGLPQ